MRAHGTRARYVHEECRCWPCVEANRIYAAELARRHRGPWRVTHAPADDSYGVKNRDNGEFVRCGGRKAAHKLRDELNEVARVRGLASPPLWADERMLAEVREHMSRLIAEGTGLRRIGQVTKIGRSRITEIWRGYANRSDRPHQRRVKWMTAERILAVRSDQQAPSALVDASETWRFVRVMTDAGLPKVRIAEAIGQTRALQLGRRVVTARHARAVRRCYEQWSSERRRAC